MRYLIEINEEYVKKFNEKHNTNLTIEDFVKVAEELREEESEKKGGIFGMMFGGQS